MVVLFRAPQTVIPVTNTAPTRGEGAGPPRPDGYFGRPGLALILQQLHQESGRRDQNRLWQVHVEDESKRGFLGAMRIQSVLQKHILTRTLFIARTVRDGSVGGSGQPSEPQMRSE